MTPTALIEQNQGLTTGGWIMMTGCITLVFSLCAFCLWRIMRNPAPSQRNQEPLDVDARDSGG